MALGSNFKKPKRGDGFIQITLLIVGALVVLKYTYDLDIVGILTTGRFKVWLDRIYGWASIGWQKYDTQVLNAWDFATAFAKNFLGKIK